MAFGDLLLGCATVDGRLRHARGGLLFEAADALHEELVQVRAGDRQELDPLQKWVLLGFSLGQNAAVEGEPGQLTVQIQARVVERVVFTRRERGRADS